MKRNIWETEKAFHCTLVSVTLNISEQRRILKKARYKEKQLSDYECHEVLVNALKDKSPLTIRMQRYLDNKFMKTISRWNNLINAEYVYEWKKSLDGDNTPAEFYGLITRPDIQQTDVDTLMGDAHILAAYKLQQSQNAQAEKNNLLLRLKNLEQKLNESRTYSRQLLNENKKLKKNFHKSEQEKDTLAKQLDKKDGQSVDTLKVRQENLDLVLRLNRADDQITSLKIELEKGRMQYSRLSSLLEKEKQANQMLTLEIARYTNKQEEDQCEACPNKPLCKKRILLVGGLTKLQPYYRNVVEKQDGIFEFHDGHIRNGDTRLCEQISRSDYVLCSLDVNSHRACLSVKRYCKKWGKSYQMLKNSGVSSVARAINDIPVSKSEIGMNAVN